MCLNHYHYSQAHRFNYSELIKTTGHDLSKTSTGIDKELTEEDSVVIQSEEDM